jgi:excisionase family DNA binding protein
MNEEMKKLLSNPTMTVSEAGKVFGMCRNTAYAAAAKGEIPTIKIGRSLKVPTALVRKQLGLEAA